MVCPICGRLGSCDTLEEDAFFVRLLEIFGDEISCVVVTPDGDFDVSDAPAVKRKKLNPAPPPPPPPLEVVDLLSDDEV